LENMSDNKSTILIVDDEESNIDFLLEILGDRYEVKVALDGPTALEQARNYQIDLILLDIMMPEMDGFQVIQELRSDQSLRDVAVIFLTALNDTSFEEKGLELGAVDYITKPFSPSVVLTRVHNYLELQAAKQSLRAQNKHLEEKVRERSKELQKSYEATIGCLASLAETRDPETGNHIQRTRYYVKAIAEYLWKLPRFSSYIDEKYIHILFNSTALHDVGKVGIPDHILLKPGKLTPEEFEEMKQHTTYGRNTLLTAEKSYGSSIYLNLGAEIAYSNHERWDGTGYPQGLQGEEIPLSARIMCIADVYDALITKRVYKPAFSQEDAVRIITQGDGRVMPSHFDPDILRAFMDLSDHLREIAIQYSDKDELG